MGVNENIIEITDQNFAETIEGSTGLTIVDFWAEWCGPCRMMAPIVEALADEYSGNGVTVGKLDVDQNLAVTVRFNVRTIPTVLFFKDGEHVGTVAGFDSHTRSTLEAKLKEHM